MSKPYDLTSADVLDRFFYRQTAHYNKGYERDARGKPLPNARQLGYGWEFCAEECPRLRFVDHIMMPDKKDYRTWHVDGEHDDLDVPQALERLRKTPVLSLTAFFCLQRLRILPPGVDADMWICGSEHGGYCDAKSKDPATRYKGIWSQARHELTAKGYLEYRDGELVKYV